MPLPLLILIALTVAAIAAALWSFLFSGREAVEARLRSITTEARPAAQVSVMHDEAPKGWWERLLIRLGTSKSSGSDMSYRPRIPVPLQPPTWSIRRG